MGEPIKILDLANKMISLNGFNSCYSKEEAKNSENIEIKFTGLRPGEKLFEELLIEGNPIGTMHPRIMSTHQKSLDYIDLKKMLEKLIIALEKFDIDEVKRIFKESPTYFNQSNDEKNKNLYANTEEKLI